ncbi:hypothetical protein GCM10008960_22280 [Deinococcus sedimenti]|uniref:Uncharacterized protein n=1 Tax=Deinococcus sedimenti TaxID=1867090 RepID=A0ABQ2S7M7_9DEIO|nr:hypothetical protein GCM10008960_22280 [Deinococcus sedimenti]
MRIAWRFHCAVKSGSLGVTAWVAPPLEGAAGRTGRGAVAGAEIGGISSSGSGETGTGTLMGTLGMGVADSAEPNSRPPSRAQVRERGIIHPVSSERLTPA